MKERIAKLIDVKSIVTLLLTLLFCSLAFKGSIPQEVNNIYLLVIGFYFGTQFQKKSIGSGDETTQSDNNKGGAA